MCIDHIHGKDNKEITINKLKPDKDGYITVYKVFCVNEKKELVPQFKDYKFHEGKNTAKGIYISNPVGHKEFTQYKPGFHSFTNEKAAQEWIDESNIAYLNSPEMVVCPVKIRKTWITDTGFQNGDRVIVSKHIVI